MSRLLAGGRSHVTSGASTYDVAQLVAVSKETGFDSGAKRSLLEKLAQGRGIDDDHSGARSSRMTSPEP